MSTQVVHSQAEDGIDALALLTPLLEKRRLILGVVLLSSLAVGVYALTRPRQFKAELSVTPVMSNRASPALGGIAALAGAALQTGYQLTPQRMVELIKSRRVLAGVGMSEVRPGSNERLMDRLIGEPYERNDPEEVQKRIAKMLTVLTNKETGTITVSVAYRDSALARMIAARVVDSASQIFVRTSKAQAQQLRFAQEARVAMARQQLARAEEQLRQFNFSNRATPAFSVASVERARLQREIQLAEQVYNQAANDQETAFARELEATPTVVVHDPLPDVLTKIRKRAVIKAAIAGIVSLIIVSLAVLITDISRRRLTRVDPESDRFRRAIATLPRIKRQA